MYFKNRSKQLFYDEIFADSSIQKLLNEFYNELNILLKSETLA